jgi:hypothetical protein
MRSTPCVISVADHTGWAYLVCVAAQDGVPEVLTRRKVALIERGLPTLPYEHDSAAMREDEAQALVERVRRSIAICSADALQRLVTDLAPTNALVSLAIRKPPFPKLPKSVAAVRSSYRLLCAADGMMYQLAICRAARDLGLDVQLCRRGEETTRAAAIVGTTPGEIEEFITRTGRPAGPPWTLEHRRAYAAGIAALAPHVRERLTLRASTPARRASRRRPLVSV